jgi:serine/threonine-protein kinase
MSPEQMRSSKRVDARTDIWALGATLYELLTGHCPFDGDSLPALVLAISHDAPTPLRNYRPEIPAELEAIVLKCLAKPVDDRFRTAGDLAAALAPFSGLGAVDLASSIQARGSFGEISSDELSLRPTIPTPPRSGDTALVNASTALDFSSSAAHTTRASSRRSTTLTVAVTVALVGVTGTAVFLGTSRQENGADAKGASLVQSAIQVSPDATPPIASAVAAGAASVSASAQAVEHTPPSTPSTTNSKTSSTAAGSKAGAKTNSTPAAPGQATPKPATPSGNLGSSVD